MGALVHLEHHRITLPDEVVAALKLKDGDALDVSVEGDVVRIVRQPEPQTVELSASARERLARLMRHRGAGKGAYASAAEVDAVIRSARDEW